ncbi:MAG: undecaprenyldiphospho-muramoylpentapeptide beta-N-acetylglucosaminyltransferase [Bacteroidales bacterium]|jgi:UDP-N-acetylglucosamine--N-acetylmuramyl-(pentapeptide) pyrophosphoryl-undecaprenol N-acetylglucosamine transferase|nr:undecaprenyldiphospho-muramoylpentapeptide beta-N-acetylglucosaminyltransferase [Bacteroidales bacterium]
MNKTMNYKPLRVIISGGGTGGHIFPAISIAGKLKEVNPDTEILFVGAEGKMEMEKVPAAGYRIQALPITGLQRQLTWKNLINGIQVPFKALRSVQMAERILREFKPDVTVGVGGYASAPLLWAATRLHIPSVIQEQNSFAGLTNKLLGKRVQRICVAYEGMEKFFPADKIVLTGNPIRGNIVPATKETVRRGIAEYGLNPANRHIFIVGGSLGSAMLNRTMRKFIAGGCKGMSGVDILWQCGKYYKEEIDAFMAEAREKGWGGEMLQDIHYSDFIGKMDLAYAAADVVVSRSGASSVSELCAARKAVVFVPSPNVAEDHQTHNAMALVNKQAALMIRDADAEEKLMPEALELVRNPAKIAVLERNIAKLALPDAAQRIVEEIYATLGTQADKQ